MMEATNDLRIRISKLEESNGIMWNELMIRRQVQLDKFEGILLGDKDGLYPGLVNQMKEIKKDMELLSDEILKYKTFGSWTIKSILFIGASLTGIIGLFYKLFSFLKLF